MKRQKQNSKHIKTLIDVVTIKNGTLKDSEIEQNLHRSRQCRRSCQRRHWREGPCRGWPNLPPNPDQVLFRGKLFSREWSVWNNTTYYCYFKFQSWCSVMIKFCLRKSFLSKQYIFKKKTFFMENFKLALTLTLGYFVRLCHISNSGAFKYKQFLRSFLVWVPNRFFPVG